MRTPNPSQCQCTHPGFCLLFKKMMDETNLHWCQNASAVDRQVYKEAYNGPIALTKESDQFLRKYNSPHDVSMLNVQIAVLGHSNKQFDTIQDRPYLKKVYLDDLNLGKYHKRFQSNAYAESRAFLCDNLFDDHADYVGVVTASWNVKYYGLNPIDNFHNWHSTKALLLSKKDNVLLCANVENSALWFDKSSKFNVLRHLGFTPRQRHGIAKVLFHDLNLSCQTRDTAVSNQLICHKNLYNRYVTFIRDNEVLLRMSHVFKKQPFQFSQIGQAECGTRGPVSLVMECVLMAWLNTQDDILIIPNEIANKQWYEPSTARERRSWYTSDVV